MSTIFFPGFEEEKRGRTDLCLISSDSIYFYTHTKVLKAASNNSFNKLVPTTVTPTDEALEVIVKEGAEGLNIILHALYGLSCAAFNPGLTMLSLALTQMSQVYGISLSSWVVPSRPIFSDLLSLAPHHPLELYALAASLQLEELATVTSSHLLSYPLSNLPEDLTSKMGAIYLRKLFFLHLGRTEALKNLLLRPPTPHSPTDECATDSEAKLTHEWSTAIAYLVWEARPGS